MAVLPNSYSTSNPKLDLEQFHPLALDSPIDFAKSISFNNYGERYTFFAVLPYRSILTCSMGQPSKV